EREQRRRADVDEDEEKANGDKEQQRIVQVLVQTPRTIAALRDQAQREPHQRAERRLDRAEVHGGAAQQKEQERDHRVRSIRPSASPPLRRSRRSIRLISPRSRS